MTGMWNPWHGCTKYSEGCANCYVYRRDSSFGKDSSIVTKTADFNLPLKKTRDGEYKIPSGSELFTVMTSDFFLDKADEWRGDIWNIMSIRSDLRFVIITKRIERFFDCIPSDWGEGYPNVSIGVTVENQRRCDIRMPIFSIIPARRKFVVCEPLLGEINISGYLSDSISQLVCGGESGDNARICDYNWVLSLREQCISANVPFYFKQTGTHFKKDGKLYTIPREKQMASAKRAGISTVRTKRI